jgi:hypothetical protein
MMRKSLLELSETRDEMALVQIISIIVTSLTYTIVSVRASSSTLHDHLHEEYSRRQLHVPLILTRNRLGRRRKSYVCASKWNDVLYMLEINLTHVSDLFPCVTHVSCYYCSNSLFTAFATLDVCQRFLNTRI